MLLTFHSANDYMDNFKVNVCGTMSVTRTVLPHFRSKSSGTIVFMGSRSGWEGDMGASPYHATKYALEGMFAFLLRFTKLTVQAYSTHSSSNSHHLAFAP